MSPAEVASFTRGADWASALPTSAVDRVSDAASIKVERRDKARKFKSVLVK